MAASTSLVGSSFTQLPPSFHSRGYAPSNLKPTASCYRFPSQLRNNRLSLLTSLVSCSSLSFSSIRWLLGCPVVYLLSKEHIADAIYNISTKYVHIFQLSICRGEMTQLKTKELKNSLNRDHAGGNDQIKQLVHGIKVYGGSVDNMKRCTDKVDNGDKIFLGADISILSLHTPWYGY